MSIIRSGNKAFAQRKSGNTSRQVSLQSIRAYTHRLQPAVADLSRCARCQTLRSYSLPLPAYAFHFRAGHTWSLDQVNPCFAQPTGRQTLVVFLLACAIANRFAIRFAWIGLPRPLHSNPH